jgi:hypothetical protein
MTKTSTKVAQSVKPGEFLTCREVSTILKISEIGVRRMLTQKKLRLYSILVGCAIGFAPLLYFASFEARHPIEIGEITRHVLSFSALPGALVAMILSGGIGHGVNLWMICLVDAVLYSWLVYFLLSLWERRKASSRRDGSSHTISSGPRR